MITPDIKQESVAVTIDTSKVRIFIDFDGTITRKDVGASMFLEYGDHDKIYKIVEDIRQLRIPAFEGWRRLFDAVPTLDFNNMSGFIDTFEIDTSFREFVQYCETRNCSLMILSDGFEFYIKQILQREGISSIPFYSNKIIKTPEGKFLPGFPYRDEECRRCANCKRNHILNHSADDDFTIYIGNGSSDTCPALYCDYIFAKDDLLKFCEKERVTFYPYRTFADIQKTLEQFFSRKRLKKRHQAVLKRNEVYRLG